MLKYSALVLLMVQLAVAIVVKKDQNSNDEPTTFPTELYQPIQSSAEQSSSKPFQAEPQSDNNYASEFPSLDLGDMKNFNKKVVITHYSMDDSIIKPEGVQQLKPVSVTRFESLNSQNPLITHSWGTNPSGWNNNPSGWSNIPSGWSNIPSGWSYNPSGLIDSTSGWNNKPNIDFETNSGTGSFKISSSNTYFDSDTMSQPETRHFSFDSTNGDSNSNIQFFRS